MQRRARWTWYYRCRADTRCRRAQPASRTTPDTGSESQLLGPIRLPPGPRRALQTDLQPARNTQEMSRSGPRGNRAEGGCRSVAGWLSPDSARVGYRSGVPERILRSTWAKRCPPSVAWTRHRRATAAPSHLARSASLAAQLGEPAAPAVLTSSRAAWGVCCLPSGPPKSRASRSVPTFPCAAHTHISGGAQIRPLLGPTAARRYSSGRQPMHLVGERPPEPRSNRGMALVAVQASLHP